MFDNIGYKIKVIAESQCLLFVLCCIVSGIYLISNEFVFLGILVFVVGFVCAPISTFLLYGFGELVDKVTKISENMEKDASNINCVENNVHEHVCSKSKVNYSGYVVLTVFTIIISIVVEMNAFVGSSSSNEGYIETIPYVTIEYNDGQQTS